MSARGGMAAAVATGAVASAWATPRVAKVVERSWDRGWSVQRVAVITIRWTVTAVPGAVVAAALWRYAGARRGDVS